MNKGLIVAGAAAVLIPPCFARADTPGVTTLVYNFSYSAAQNITARDSGDSIESVDTEQGYLNTPQAGGTNGISHYAGKLDDKGTMTVQIVGKPQADGGQIVTISEAGEQQRRAPQATCVVYGNTNVICDPNKTVYTEEYTLLRFLGANFVDPNQLDKNKHWQISQNSSVQDVTADYVINSNTNGTMQIGETRKIREANGGNLTTDIQTHISYDSSKSIPTSVDEYATQRHDNGVQGNTRTIYQTTLQLVSDTVGKS